MDLPSPPGRASEREGNILKGFNDFHLKYGPRQGQNLALAVVLVPNSPEEEGITLGLVEKPFWSVSYQRGSPVELLDPSDNFAVHQASAFNPQP